MLFLSSQSAVAEENHDQRNVLSASRLFISPTRSFETPQVRLG